MSRYGLTLIQGGRESVHESCASESGWSKVSAARQDAPRLQGQVLTFIKKSGRTRRTCAPLAAWPLCFPFAGWHRNRTRTRHQNRQTVTKSVTGTATTFFPDNRKKISGRCQKGPKRQANPSFGHFSDIFWAHTQGFCKRGSGGQSKMEKIRATFWDFLEIFAICSSKN